MEPHVYDTVMNANRTGHLPCHERYAERRIMLKAAHTNQCELLRTANVLSDYTGH